MQELELLAPARNADIGIAAIDCGADAVYIAGPAFGARKDAGNPVEEIGRLCSYAHKFGARVFVTFNILIRDDELPELHSQMLDAQKAGADAFIVRDMRICGFTDITVPLHASTQCSIRDSQRAREFISCGCSRVVLERELSLDNIRSICHDIAPCEVEVFVHGALCVCYSGQCTLSEHLSERSADRGECIQACRNLYDLQRLDGTMLAKNKAVLSLKDYNLTDRLEELAEAGASSFKIEGRLKNSSYVQNTVRAYSNALDSLLSLYPDKYCRASFGSVRGGFTPNLDKTFNRGWTTLFLDGERGKWSSFETPKSMGELLGTIASVKKQPNGTMQITIKERCALQNGDGFSVVTSRGITGFRGDVCGQSSIICKEIDGLKAGQQIWRNVSVGFEKELERNACSREIPVELTVSFDGLTINLYAKTQDGREAACSAIGTEYATNTERMLSMLKSGLCKSSSVYRFETGPVSADKTPLLSSAQINEARRTLSAKLDSVPVNARQMSNTSKRSGAIIGTGRKDGELMRSKYCIRHEFGLCPKTNRAEKAEDLILLNNGKKLIAKFHCRECEMSIEAH